MSRISRIEDIKIQDVAVKKALHGFQDVDA
jgi:hypothetical protein